MAGIENLFDKETELQIRKNMKRLGSRDRSRSPAYKSRSRSPREWKRPERRNTDRGRDAVVRLFVSNLPYDVRWQDLKDLFREKVGSEVSFVELYETPEGKPSGSGAVEVKGAEMAQKAIDILHKQNIKGRNIIVREEREKDRVRTMTGGGGGRHDGGGGGRDNNMMRMNDGMGGGPRMNDGMMGGPNMMGMGGAGGMIDAMNTASMMNMMGAGNLMGSGSLGNNFSVQLLAQLGIDPSTITNQVFVANLDYKVTVNKMEEIFRIAGNVIEVDLKTDKEGRSRGMGTVRFEHPIEAVQAISLFNGQYLYERQMGVRMDKWVDPVLQDIPRRLPSGLRNLGVGLGTNGQPLLNIAQLSS